MAASEWSPVLAKATAFMAIGADAVHYYTGLAEMLDDQERQPGPVECFDADRYRLAFEVGAGGVVTDLWRTGEQADEGLLIGRMDRMINRRTAALDRQLSKVESGKAEDPAIGVARETRFQLQELKHAGGFAERFAMLQRPPFWHDDENDPNSGSAVHNCFAHLRCF